MVETKQVVLSSGKILQVEKHSNADLPLSYPHKIVQLGNGTVGLVEPHSTFYIPTRENQKKLYKITRASTGWAYMTYRQRTR